MFKNKLFKKIISYLISASLMLSVLPQISFAAEDTTTPVIYDAYISGNFVVGKTLTANYSFDNPNVDIAKTNATIKWYAEGRTGTKKELATGSNTYIATTEKDGNFYMGMFFSVTPKDASGNTIGKTVFSNYGSYAISGDTNATTAPEVLNATIVPLNPDGSTLVGDTLAARFSYREKSCKELKTAKYQWLTGNSYDSSQATEVEGATQATYTIRPEDSGKWIFVRITAVASDDTEKSLTTKTHTGNAFRLSSVKYDTDKSEGVYGYTYDQTKFLADNSTFNNANSANGLIALTKESGIKKLVVDAGKMVPFNGFYIYHHVTSNEVGVSSVEAFYSSDGQNWTSFKKYNSESGKEADTGNNRAEKEALIYDKVIYARYFKLELNKTATTSGTRLAVINDFYPFVCKNALPKISLEGDDEVSLLAAPDAPAYEDSGYILQNIPQGYTENEIKTNFIVKTITNKEGNIVSDIDPTTKGQYKLTYTLAMPGLDKVSVERKIVIGNGQKTPGNLAYYYEEDKNEVTYTNIIDKNSIDGAPAFNDGNENTICEVGSDGALLLPASAVVEVNDPEADETYVSKFVIKENGENITEYNIYVSTDGVNWGESVHRGVSVGNNCVVILTTPVRADFVKFEIVSAENKAQIKEFEVHLDDDSKIYMAKELLLEEFENKVKALNHRDGYIYKNIPLTTSSLYGTKAIWTVSGVSADVAYADNVNEVLKIVRQDEETDFNLKLKLEFTDESKVGIFMEETLPTLVIAKKSAPKAIDVHITGNFVMGQTLTIPDSYYYDEAGVPEDKSATKIQWYRANKWGSTASSSGYLSATLPSTQRTYTIKVEDVYDSANLLYNIYASITPASMADDDAKMGSASFTPLYTTPSTVSGDDAPTISTPYISTLSKKGTLLAGDTVKVHYAYINRGEVAEGGTSYRWQTRANLNDAPTILTSDSPLNKTYTLTEADFGKWIECVITPKSASGAKGTAVIARNYYGNAFLANEAVYYGGSGLRSKPTIGSMKVMAYHENAYLFGSNSGEDKGIYSDATSGETKENFTYAGGDAGSIRPFNAFYVKVGAVAFNDLEFFYKVNEADEWIKLEITSSSNDLGANKSELFEIVGGAKLARYFRMKSKTASGYAELYGFFPCLTQSAGAYMEFPEDLRITKGDMSFSVNTAFISAKNAVGSDAAPSVLGSVNVNSVGQYPVTYTIETPGDVWFPTYSVTKTFTVVDGIATEGDEAFGADASVSNGSGASNLTDGNPNTSWIGEGTGADIQIDLGSTKAVSEIKINEDTSNITNVDVYTSTNGTDWVLKADNAVLSDGTVTIEATEAKYVKLSLSYSSSPTVSGIEVSADKEAKAQLALAALSLPSSASSDIALIEKGLYNTSISWLSNNPSVITADGSVTRQSSDTVVTLTARIMDGDSVLASRSFHITVLKKEAQQSASKPSGSSGGSSFGVSGPAPAPTPVTPQTIPSYNYKNFADVPETHWAADYVNKLYESEIISGRGNGSFEPEAQITRAEFLKLIVEGLKLSSDDAKAEFADVSSNDWFYGYVAVANALGIAKGNEGLFNPNEPILRRDMAVIAQRALAACSITLNKLADANLSDIETVADYAKEAVELLSSAGIINGNENREFMPNKNATRAETTKIIYMLLENIK